MDQILGGFVAHPIATLGVGAFFSGVALFYLVMQRTRKQRIREAERMGL